MARVFNGTNQYCELGSAVISSGAATLSAWIYVPSSTDLIYGLSMFNTSGQHFWHIRHVNGQGFGAFRYTGVSSSHRYVGTNASVGWHHVAGVWTATNTTAPTLYVDGVAVSGVSQNGSGTLTVNRTGIASIIFDGARYYSPGRVAFAAIHSAALDADECGSLGQFLNGVPCGVHPTMVRPDALVACWDLGGFAGDDDRDTWGGYDLTAYNSPTFDESPAVIYPDDVLLTGPGVSAGGGGGGSGVVSRILQQHGVVLGA